MLTVSTQEYVITELIQICPYILATWEMKNNFQTCNRIVINYQNIAECSRPATCGVITNQSSR